MILYPPFLKRGITLMPSLILIPQWAKTDAAYLAHEQVHAAQQKRMGVFTFWRLYLTDKTARKWIEVEAYRMQIAHGASLDYCAHQLATGYNLNIDFKTAKQLLE